VGYASKLGRARISSRNPQAAGKCDRCGFIYNHCDLRWQHDWAGAAMINKRILVCTKCTDVAQEQLRSLILPPDPMPIMNARTEDYVRSETDYRTTTGQDTVNAKTGIAVPGNDKRITESDGDRVTQQTGFANGSLNEEPGTDPNAPGDSDPGLPYNNDEVPQTGPI